MIAKYKTLLLATATAMLMPAIASAATVTVNESIVADQSYSSVGVISPGDTLEFRFTVLEDLLIETFSVSATGTDAEDDISDIRFGYFEPATNEFTTIGSVGSVAAGFGFLDGMTFMSGDIFSVFFEDGITNDVGVTLSFETETIPPIPLPATALLMLPIFLAGGIAGWRRSKAAQAAA